MKSTIINKNDPRVIKTRKQFFSTFKELVLVYDDYMSITVKELCDKAGLNRKTFYLHYKQVDDLFTELQNEAISDFYNAVKGIDVLKDVEGVVRAFFELNEANPVYQKMNLLPSYLYTKELSLKKTTSFLSEQKLIDAAQKHSVTIQEFYFLFYHVSVYALYRKWVKTNRPIPKEEAIQLVAKIVKNGISSIHD